MLMKADFMGQQELAQRPQENVQLEEQSIQQIEQRSEKLGKPVRQRAG